MLVSYGSTAHSISYEDIRDLVGLHVREQQLADKRVLLIVPDKTRSGPTPLFLRALAERLCPIATGLDAMVALGTHDPLKGDAFEEYTRAIQAGGDCGGRPPRILQHHFRATSQLRLVANLSAAEVSDMTMGYCYEQIPFTIDKAIFDYDHVVICGPVFPHEVAGFSGGHKYLIPGIAGREVIDLSHWLGALITSPLICGQGANPVRAMIEGLADRVPVERSLAAYVVENEVVRGVFLGQVREAWREAAHLSGQIHIKTWADGPFGTVIACASRRYDDLWTAGKSVYKCETLVKDGGTLIVYAPGVTRVSTEHGDYIREARYHTRDYFVHRWESVQHIPKRVLAHCTHVRGVGFATNRYDQPRINVVLATGIPEDECRRVNLRYRDPASVDIEAMEGKPDVLVIPDAGETLHRLSPSEMVRFKRYAYKPIETNPRDLPGPR